MNIGALIQTITPLYNQYKLSSKSILGTEALIIMWEVGDVIKQFVEKNNIAPHQLYLMVYGKSDGTNDIVQKSYITRDFQDRCFRVRRIFSKKDDIEILFPNLQKVWLFNKSMPFFDNNKYFLPKNEKDKLVNLLNSDRPNKEIAHKIGLLRKSIIGVTNPRTQKLPELNEEKKLFIEFFNSIYKLVNERRATVIKKLKDVSIDSLGIITLAKNTNSLSQDGLKFYDFNISKDAKDPLWVSFIELLKKFAAQKNPQKVRRFRRLVSPEKIVNLADMLDKLSSNVS